ncbi:hypothetical protein KQX54_016874 [Cotesia glomerata]|uniref:Uncharacterized protein n=1 Tax=Cotesia glomerata TaxID=32391 RepID=A0AAV7IG16_COTGL|nr:hypothetical protein KQX54_016874 [Cotesia glomerata]
MVGTRLESDHLPVKVIIDSDGMQPLGVTHTAPKEPTDYIKRNQTLRWKTEKAEEYIESLAERWTEHDLNADPVSWSQLKITITDMAKSCNMIKKTKNKRSKFTDPWYNHECRLAKKSVWKNLKKYLRDRNTENKTLLIQSRKIFRATRDSAENSWKERKWEQLNKCRDMSDWWRTINSYRGKNFNAPSEEISGRQWIEHFSSLLNCNSDTTNSGINANDNYNNEVKDNFLDENFTMQELQDTLKTLRNELETINHLFICAEARKLCSAKVGTALQKLTEGKYQADLDACIRQLLRGPPIKEICIYFKEIERRKDTW